MKLAFITDEMTQRFDEAFDFAVENGLDGLELRSVEDMPIDAIPEETLRAWKQRLDAAGLAVPNLASTFYKCDLSDTKQIEADWDKLERLCVRADILGTSFIRGFTFFAAGAFADVMPAILDLYAKPLEILERYDKVLLLEADPSVNGTNHAEIAAFIATLGSERVRAIFDPGNDIYDPKAETPYPDGYLAIRDFMAHVHIKDAVHTANGPECVKIGTGLVDYKALLKQLVADGYDGWLSLETHYRAGIVLTEEQMRIPQGADFSSGGRLAMEESLASLRDLLAEAKEANA